MAKPAILLVRPANRMAQDSAICVAAGWQPIPFSPMVICPDANALANLPQQYQQADAVFWVSPSAVEMAQTAWSFPADGKPHIAVGKATAAALQQAACQNVICPAQGNDSEAVAQLAIWHTLPAQARILIVRGQGGRECLAHDLRTRGFRVDYAEIYRRETQSLDWTLWQTIQPQAVWITSRELVQGLFQQAPLHMVQTLQSLLYFTHHPRIAEALYQAGVQRVKLITALDAATLMNKERNADE